MLDRRAAHPEPPLRRASDQTPLGRLRGRVEYAFGTGDYAAAAAFIEEEPLAAWFGFETPRFLHMLTVIAENGVPLGLFSQAVLSMVASQQASGHTQNEPPASIQAGAQAEILENLAIGVRLFSLRLSGRPVEALEYTVKLKGSFAVLEPLFDSVKGWALFSSVQHGITAMLAGDFSEALVSFEEARAHVFVPPLAFLTRDALLRQALLEASFGDQVEARTLLELAEDIPRTESWVEETIDASRDLVVALVHSQSSAEMLERLEAIQSRAIGELWPFYILALHRANMVPGKIIEARHSLYRSERIPWVRVDGQGYSGSVFPLSRATLALARGELDVARDATESADQNLALTRIVRGVLEIAAGRPREAIELVTGLYEQTRELRMLNLWRLAVLAAGYFAINAEDDCLDVLKYATEATGGLRPVEVAYFPGAVREFAYERVSGWPEDMRDPNDSNAVELFPELNAVLTAREVEVLRALASGMSREEIARSQFVSLNTLKAHLRSVYKKLEVGTRAAAVLEAERRGFI